MDEDTKEFFTRMWMYVSRFYFICMHCCNVYIFIKRNLEKI